MKHTHGSMSEMHCVLYITGIVWYRLKCRGVGITVIIKRSNSKGYIQYDAGRIAFLYGYRDGGVLVQCWRHDRLLEERDGSLEAA